MPRNVIRQYLLAPSPSKPYAFSQHTYMLMMRCPTYAPRLLPIRPTSYRAQPQSHNSSTIWVACVVGICVCVYSVPPLGVVWKLHFLCEHRISQSYIWLHQFLILNRDRGDGILYEMHMRDGWNDAATMRKYLTSNEIHNVYVY